MGLRCNDFVCCNTHSMEDQNRRTRKCSPHHTASEVRLFAPPGPLAGGSSPVPPVRSTATLTPAGPQAPCEPAMLQRVAFLVDSLHGPSVRISDKDVEFQNSLFYADGEAVGEDMLD